MFDTDVLIWYFRGNPGARDFIAGVPFKDRLVSALCVMELIQGCRDKKEIKTVKAFIRMNFSAILPPDERISEKAILLLEKHSPSDGLRTVDALIAASAVVNHASLATANYKHFRNIQGLSILKFEAAEM